MKKSLSDFILCENHKELKTEFVEQGNKKFIITGGTLEYPNNTEYWVLVFVLDDKGGPESIGFLKELKNESQAIHQVDVIAEAMKKKMLLYDPKKKEIIDLVDLL